METCYRHPDRETGVACSSCGRPICPDCMTPTPVGMRCPECSRQRTTVRTMSSLVGRPVVTYALIAINVVMFLAESVSAARFSGVGGGSLTQHAALYGPAVANGEWWRLITGGFLHAGLLHIGLNMYILWFLGRMLEPAIGRVRFLLIYFVSLLAGSFGALVVTPHALTVGASGAIFGLAGAGVIVMRSRGIDPRATGLPLFIGINLLLSFAISGISIGGHIGGLIGGALAALVLFELPERVRRIPAVIPAALAAVIGAAAVAGSFAVVS